jgi:hypothetical protein
MPADPLYEILRRLAVEDPREARKVFLGYLDSGGPALEHLLGQISSPADGQLPIMKSILSVVPASRKSAE